MNNKLLSLVANQAFAPSDLIKFCEENLSLNIINSNILSNQALEVEIENFDENKTQDLEKIFDDKKVDFCIRDKNYKNFKV